MINLPKFNEIQHAPLRVYNRTVAMMNVKEDFGEDTLREYISMFDDTERKQIFLMLAAIKTQGVDSIKKDVMKNMPVSDTDFSAR